MSGHGGRCFRHLPLRVLVFSAFCQPNLQSMHRPGQAISGGVVCGRRAVRHASQKCLSNRRAISGGFDARRHFWSCGGSQPLRRLPLAFHLSYEIILFPKDGGLGAVASVNNTGGVSGRVIGVLLGAIPLAVVALGAWSVWTSPRTLTEKAKLSLCHAAAACKKYSEPRLECATAGNFKTCLRIKMGNDASYSGMCSGYDEGAPAVPLPPETPNAVACFFRNLLQ